MAARTRKIKHDDEGRFFVYRILGEQSETLYVGKGSGRRAKVQAKRFGGKYEILKRFASEAAAYKAERSFIAELAPLLNKCPGGNGNRCSRVRRPKWEVEMDRVGTRVYAARALMSFGREALLKYMDASKVDEIRRVANGGGT